MKSLKQKFIIAVISLVMGVALSPFAPANIQTAHALPPRGSCPTAADNMTMSMFRMTTNGTTLADLGPIVARPPFMSVFIGTEENPIRFNIPAGAQINVEAGNTGAFDYAGIHNEDFPEGFDLWMTNDNGPNIHQAITPPLNRTTSLVVLAQYDFPGCNGFPSTPVTCVNPGGATGTFPPSSCYSEPGIPSPPGGSPATSYNIVLFIEFVVGTPPTNPTGSYSLTVTPTSPIHVEDIYGVLKGTNKVYTVTAGCSGGATGPIQNLLASSPFPNLYYTFSSTSVNCGQSVTLTVGNTEAIPLNMLSTPQQRLPQTVTVTGSGG